MVLGEMDAAREKPARPGCHPVHDATGSHSTVQRRPSTSGGRRGVRLTRSGRPGQDYTRSGLHRAVGTGRRWRNLGEDKREIGENSHTEMKHADQKLYNKTQMKCTDLFLNVALTCMVSNIMNSPTPAQSTVTELFTESNQRHPGARVDDGSFLGDATHVCHLTPGGRNGN